MGKANTREREKGYQEKIIKMLLWRRNVKISHYTVGAGPIETGLLYVLLSGLVCLLGPVLLTLYGDDFYDNSELRFITPLVAYAKESVLIVHDDSDDLWIYSTRDNDANTNLACSVKSSQLEQRVRHSFDCSVENVVAFELYTYFNYQMSGFSQSTQLHQVASSSFRASMRAEIDVRAIFVQSTNQLLPLSPDSVSSSPSYVPSKVGAAWTSGEARANHTRREVRFDLMPLAERWQGGVADVFELEVTYDFPDVLVARTQKLWNKIKFYFVQLLAFLIAFCFVVNKLNSYLFESNMFTTFMRIESTPQINAAKAS